MPAGPFFSGVPMKAAIPSVTICLLLSCAGAAAHDAAGQPGSPLSADELAALNGGTGQTIGLSYQALSATSTGNSIEAQSVVTGNVVLQQGSLGSFNGIGNFVFNTGNNNTLQGALSVTIMVPGAN